MLVATVLSQRTNDDVTFPAAQRLLDRYPDARSLAQANASRLESIIEPVGFYRQKAKALVRLARTLLEEHGGRVPRDEQALLALPQVGRKTMNCVRVYAFGEPVVAVDTHVHRIANRLGWVDTEDPGGTEVELEQMLTRLERLEVNELLVRFGREICKPVGPRCGDCMLRDLCPSARDVEPMGLGEAEQATMLSRIAASTAASARQP